MTNSIIFVLQLVELLFEFYKNIRESVKEKAEILQIPIQNFLSSLSLWKWNHFHWMIYQIVGLFALYICNVKNYEKKLWFCRKKMKTLLRGERVWKKRRQNRCMQVRFIGQHWFDVSDCKMAGVYEPKILKFRGVKNKKLGCIKKYLLDKPKKIAQCPANQADL